MGESSMILLVSIVVFALVFDFTNGFHDTANSIATMVGTRALPPQVAVAIAAIFNFVGAFAGTEVAAAVGKEIIDSNAVAGNLNIVLAGLTGAIVWNLITWYFGIPSSSSHALIGGLIGAAVVGAGSGAVHWDKVNHKILQPAVAAPIIGFLMAMLVMGILMRIFSNANPHKANRRFRIAQIFSGVWLSFSHGANDAQKTMGIISLALVVHYQRSPDQFEVPLWVIFSAATAMGLGTYAGGWKIIKTLGTKVVKMSPIQGFTASTTAAAVLMATKELGMPVSTTHCVSGCVMGAGASKRLSSVRWTVAADIVTAWIFTLPCAAAVGMVAYMVATISPMLLIAVTTIGGWFLYSHVERKKMRSLDQGFTA